jgi:EAL domain-containing protein (putative c-di-GMP-specific phosphodiesterase class I)
LWCPKGICGSCTSPRQKIAPLQGQDEFGGYELLLRSLEKPDDNHAPATLLSAALRNHLAPDLDLWVIERALIAAAPYRSELRMTSASLSVNITAPALTDESFLKRVREYAWNQRVVERLRELGVQYAQGYGVEKPRAFADVLQELRARQTEQTEGSLEL